jgi:hypothetical protein
LQLATAVGCQHVGGGEEGTSSSSGFVPLLCTQPQSHGADGEHAANARHVARDFTRILFLQRSRLGIPGEGGGQVARPLGALREEGELFAAPMARIVEEPFDAHVHASETI